MKGKELLTLAVALVLALALTGCAPKDAGVAILTGLDKKELAPGRPALPQLLRGGDPDGAAV